MPSLLPLLLFFLLLLPPLSKPKPCPPCGTNPVPFPLSTSSKCNDPDYPIACNSSTSTLVFTSINSSSSTPNFSYPILRVDPSTKRLIISPAPFLSPSSCVTSDFPRGGLSLDPSSPFNITSSNRLFYLNCTESILKSPLNCSTSSPCYAYVKGTACAGENMICCSLKAGGGGTAHQVRTREGGCSAYRSFVGLDPGNFPVEMWGQKEGVEIQWKSPREPLCTVQRDCEDGSNATCRVDPEGGPDGGGVRRCLCVDGFGWDPIAGSCVYNATDCHARGDCNDSHKGSIIAGLISALGAALLISIACYFVFNHRRGIREARKRLAQEREEILNANSTGGRTAHNFTGREMRKATNNFSEDNLLGSGGYGEVYKGTLRDGTLVAVKLAKLGNTKSIDQVLNEVRILSQVNHRSLVCLLGCCVELQQPLMVYEYIPNGTLFDHLNGLYPSLSWRHRLMIAHQTAKGLAYLHFSAVQPIYHRDVKSSNILLDEKLNAKVSDFGLSRLAETDISHISTCAQGTLGYLDPEYYRNYQLTDKSDVYSFGVVLLELLTSLKAIDFNRGPEDVNLAVYVQRMVEEERLMEVVDPELKKGASKVALDTMKAIGFLASGCLEEKSRNRPSMKEVVEEIGYIMKIEAEEIVEHHASCQ